MLVVAPRGSPLRGVSAVQHGNVMAAIDGPQVPSQAGNSHGLVPEAGSHQGFRGRRQGVGTAAFAALNWNQVCSDGYGRDGVERLLLLYCLTGPRRNRLPPLICYLGGRRGFRRCPWMFYHVAPQIFGGALCLEVAETMITVRIR